MCPWVHNKLEKTPLPNWQEIPHEEATAYSKSALLSQDGKWPLGSLYLSAGAPAATAVEKTWIWEMTSEGLQLYLKGWTCFL